MNLLLAAVVAGCTDAPRGSPVEPLPDDVDVSRIVDSVRAAYDLPALGAMIVTREDARVAIGVAGRRRAAGGAPVTSSDRWHLGSNFKAFTGMLAAIAVGRGSVAWTTTLADAFPELVGTMRPEYRGVTLRELLTHSAGLPRDPTFAITGATRRAQRDAVARWAVAQPPATPRGSFAYSNTGYLLAGALLERALGADFEDAMAAAVFAPLGIDDAGWGPQAPAGSTQQPVAHQLQNGAWRALENHDNPPVYASAGGAHMSMGSWAKFLQEVLRLEAGAPTIVPLAAGRETTASLATIAPGEAYGLGWGITSRSWAGGRALNHSGSNVGNFSVAWLAPERDFGVLVVTNSYDPGAARRSAVAADALVGRLIGFHLTGR